MHRGAAQVKIYHGPQNIGGMAGVLASAQRDIGFTSISCCYTTGNFRYKSDQEIPLNNNYKKRFWELLKLLIKTTGRYNIFQFYFGESITGPFLLELPLLKILRKKIFFYFCGCDIRDSKLTIEKYRYSACKECWPMACSANQKKALKSALKYANAIFVSTPDLIEFIPGSILLPQPIDINTFESMKGTRYIEEAVSTLIASGYSIELLLVENLPYEEALHKCANADIVIDQLLIGSYGQYSVEMMALGKPVICYLRDDLLRHYSSELPIVNANPSNLIEVLKNLLDRKDDWDKLGRQGVKYVQQNHDSKVIAKKLIEHYKI